MKRPSRLAAGSGLAAAVAAAALLSAVAPSAANAATTGAPRLSPDTSAVSCSSDHVWLALWGSAGETCYTGNGGITVHLTGVHKGQIIGERTVCLYTPGNPVTFCTTGAGVFGLNPPVQVTGISIATP
jgi:hypothetical protein